MGQKFSGLMSVRALLLRPGGREIFFRGEKKGKEIVSAASNHSSLRAQGDRNAVKQLKDDAYYTLLSFQ